MKHVTFYFRCCHIVFVFILQTIDKVFACFIYANEVVNSDDKDMRGKWRAGRTVYDLLMHLYRHTSAEPHLRYCVTPQKFQYHL